MNISELKELAKKVRAGIIAEFGEDIFETGDQCVRNEGDLLSAIDALPDIPPLSGYRELGAKVATAEDERDAARAERDSLQKQNDALWNGDLDCDRCGRFTNNGRCTECSHGVSPFAKLEASRDALAAEAAKLHEVLKKLRAGEHAADCPARNSSNNCFCGMSTLRARIDIAIHYTQTAEWLAQHDAKVRADERAKVFPRPMLLQWQQRKDGLWNADCPCGASLCGTVEHMRIAIEALHLGETGKLAELNHYAEKHRRAFAAANSDWLKKWWELSARYWKANREAATYYDGTIVAFEVLQLQDKMRQELFGDLFKAEGKTI